MPPPAVEERRVPPKVAPIRRSEKPVEELQGNSSHLPHTPDVPSPVFRTHHAVVAEDQSEPIEQDELVKGFEYQKGQYVVLENAELKSLTAETSKEMQIVEFVRLAEVDPIFFETSYYLAPEEAGERPYALLLEAFRQTGYVGVAQLAMHRREHVVIIRPGASGMIAHTMFYPEEVRRDQEYRPDPVSIVPRELDLAKRLIETLVVPFEPQKFKDRYRERLEMMIAEKVKGNQISREPAGSSTKPAAALDILQALQESLNMAKKPPASSQASKPARTAARARK